MPITTNRDKLRLRIGDTDVATPLFSDDELDVFLADQANNVLLAAADACDVLATRFAGDFDFETDGQKFSRSSKSKAYSERAKALRERALGGLNVIVTTRSDGYSDDIDTHQGAGTVTATGHTIAGYYTDDLPA